MRVKKVYNFLALISAHYSCRLIHWGPSQFALPSLVQVIASGHLLVKSNWNKKCQPNVLENVVCKLFIIILFRIEGIKLTPRKRFFIKSYWIFTRSRLLQTDSITMSRHWNASALLANNVEIWCFSVVNLNKQSSCMYFERPCRPLLRIAHLVILRTESY